MPDDYPGDIRQELELYTDGRLILQSACVVKRKGIEHAIELVSRLGMKARLVTSHFSLAEKFYSYTVLHKKLMNLMV